MAKNNKRTGKRKPRREIGLKEPKLGYYFIVTDAEETEKNYFQGIRESLPQDEQRNIVIKIVPNIKPNKLVDKCIEENKYNPAYSEPWIIFDRDQVDKFDSIVNDAIKNDINVGWSNPCFEIWLSAYFGNIPYKDTSWSCCDEFGRIYKNNTGQDYKKNNTSLYKKLIDFGDEEKAIDRARKRREEFLKDGISIPSKMCPCTTVDILIDKIRRRKSDSE